MELFGTKMLVSSMKSRWLVQFDLVAGFDSTGDIACEFQCGLAEKQAQRRRFRQRGVNDGLRRSHWIARLTKQNTRRVRPRVR